MLHISAAKCRRGFVRQHHPNQQQLLLLLRQRQQQRSHSTWYPRSSACDSHHYTKQQQPRSRAFSTATAATTTTTTPTLSQLSEATPCLITTRVDKIMSSNPGAGGGVPRLNSTVELLARPHNILGRVTKILFEGKKIVVTPYPVSPVSTSSADYFSSWCNHDNNDTDINSDTAGENTDSGSGDALSVLSSLPSPLAGGSMITGAAPMEVDPRRIGYIFSEALHVSDVRHAFFRDASHFYHALAKLDAATNHHNNHQPQRQYHQERGMGLWNYLRDLILTGQIIAQVDGGVDAGERQLSTENPPPTIPPHFTITTAAATATATTTMASTSLSPPPSSSISASTSFDLTLDQLFILVSGHLLSENGNNGDALSPSSPSSFCGWRNNDATILKKKPAMMYALHTFLLDTWTFFQLGSDGKSFRLRSEDGAAFQHELMVRLRSKEACLAFVTTAQEHTGVSGQTGLEDILLTATTASVGDTSTPTPTPTPALRASRPQSSTPTLAPLQLDVGSDNWWCIEAIKQFATSRETRSASQLSFNDLVSRLLVTPALANKAPSSFDAHNLLVQLGIWPRPRPVDETFATEHQRRIVLSHTMRIPPSSSPSSPSTSTDWSLDEYQPRLNLMKHSQQDHAAAESLANSILTAPESYVDTSHNGGGPSARRDLRDLACYAIDSADTTEVDDAFCMEQCPSDGDEPLREDEWILVHIADPSAVIQPHSSVDLAARKRAETVYLPDSRLNMIPEILSEGALSLRPNQPSHAFTYRVRLDPKTGSIAEYSVFPSTINAMLRFTYDETEVCLQGAQTRTIGGGGSNKVDEKSQIQLRRLLRWAMLRRQYRVSCGARLFEFPAYEPYVKLAPDGSVLDIEIDDKNAAAPMSRKLVEEMMVLVGEITGQFAYQEGIPVPYRVQAPPVPGDEIERGCIEANSTTLSPNATPEGLHLARLFHNMHLNFAADTSAHPGPHSSVGAQFYARASSPIRRYSDLVCQYQLKAFLSTSSSWSGGTGGAGSLRLPFSKPHVEYVAQQLDTTSKVIKALQADAERFWKAQYVFRYGLSRPWYGIVVYGTADTPPQTTSSSTSTSAQLLNAVSKKSCTVFIVELGQTTSVGLPWRGPLASAPILAGTSVLVVPSKKGEHFIWWSLIAAGDSAAKQAPPLRIF